MLKIFICPECYNIRMVSKRPGAICLHCNRQLVECDIEYTEYTNMSETDREDYKSRWKMDNDIHELRLQNQ